MRVSGLSSRAKYFLFFNINMLCLNISQNVTRKTFKITRKYPPNNPQPHQENGASDATERLKIDNQVAGVNTVALIYGNRSALVCGRV